MRRRAVAEHCIRLKAGLLQDRKGKVHFMAAPYCREFDCRSRAHCGFRLVIRGSFECKSLMAEHCISQKKAHRSIYRRWSIACAVELQVVQRGFGSWLGWEK